MVKKPFIGKLDRRIQIVHPVKSPDLAGGITTTDTVIATVWAALDDLSGIEVVDGKEMHIVKRTYTIRYHSEVVAIGKDCVIVADGKRFKIDYPLELGRKQFLVLNASLYE